MPKTAMVRARMRPRIKERAEKIFDRLGLTATQAITLFYRQVKMRRGLPFNVAVPNTTKRKTFGNTDAGEGLVVCRDAKDMFEKLGI